MARARRLAGVVLFVVAAGPTAAAAPLPVCAPPAGEAVAGARVAGPFELVLPDGTRLRLAGVGLAAPGEGEAAAAAALQALVAGRAVRAEAGPPRLDRYGRRITRVAAGGGGDLGEQLVAAGMAIAGPAPHAALAGPCRVRLRAAEAAARRAGRGLWADGTFRIDAAGDRRLAARAGRFAVVHGRIVSVGKAGRTRYLNFGRRWSLDFTATIAESEGAWPRGWGIGPDALQGAHVRVRGWLESDDGGLVRLARPEDLEWIGPVRHADEGE